MKKVAIVGVEGSGKTVMLAGLGDLYSSPDAEGYFLSPKNDDTADYVVSKMGQMRSGAWPTATAGDEIRGLDWTLRRMPKGRGLPENVSEVSFLDFAGEVYRAAFDAKAPRSERDLSSEVEALRRYVETADELIVLINLRDVIVRGVEDERVKEATRITNSIFDFAFEEREGRSVPRAAIVISQSESYRETIEACGGAAGVLKRYLPYVANHYGWLDVFTADAVDKTVLDANGVLLPEPGFSAKGLKAVMDWILDDRKEDLEAQCERGTMYEEGRGVAKDEAEAVRWYRQAAEQGHARAQFRLGVMYKTGRGVAKSNVEAEKWFRKSAAQGNEYAIRALTSR